jgi:hypothetical protein
VGLQSDAASSKERDHMTTAVSSPADIFDVLVGQSSAITGRKPIHSLTKLSDQNRDDGDFDLFANLRGLFRIRHR